MNGKRAKQLRRELAQSLGHSPKGVEIVSENYKTGEVAFIPSEWRRGKGMYKTARRNGIRS